MNNLIGTNLQTLESAYAYMQSMLIPSFVSFHQTIARSSSTNQANYNEFVHEEQFVAPDEQLQSQEHERVRRQLTRNKQPPIFELMDTGDIKHFKILYTMNDNFSLLID